MIADNTRRPAPQAAGAAPTIVGIWRLAGGSMIGRWEYPMVRAAWAWCP
jgi:hypothetical protein